MDRQLVRQQVTALSGLYRIDVADNVGYRNVGRRELLDKSIPAMNPVDLRLITVKLDLLSSVRAQRRKWIVIDLRSGDDRDLFVQQLGELADDPRFGLAPKTEQDKIMLSKYCVDYLWNYRF